MSKAYYEAIEVTLIDRRPQTITWRQNTYTVHQILDRWILQNKWWEQEEKRLYYLIETDRATMEIYRVGPQWTLARVMD
jgi:hypothetical protein